MKTIVYAMALIGALLLTGCDDAGNPNQPPHAVATVSAQTVEEGESVTFDGSSSSDSDGEIVSYKWISASGETLSSVSHFSHVFTAPGVQTITLEVKDNDGEANSTSVTVTVTQAADTTAPVITLNGDANVALTVGDVYTEQGATATDDRDGNVSVSRTGRVDTDTAGTYTVTYTATDAAGNTATATRTVTVTQAADTTKPVITLLGDANIILPLGDNYVEAGATASDDRDGNITANIVMTGRVDTDAVGTYTLTYDVSDAAGNAADTVSRVINVKPVSDLALVIEKEGSGAIVSSIKSRGVELAATGSKLFVLSLQNLQTNDTVSISSVEGWRTVRLDRSDEGYTIQFLDPANQDLPNNLAVSMHIGLEELNASQWDLNVTGIGAQHSLVNVRAPELHLQMKPNAKMLIPKYSGLLRDVNESFSIADVDTSHPKDNALTYPGGWEATMQFSAYYAGQFGLYLATHDKHAALKKFYYAKEGNALVYGVDIVPPDKTLPNNTFHFPGHFELDSFTGDWFDASKHYLAWAEADADYFPHMTAARVKRQHKIGEIGLWGVTQLITVIENMPDSEHKENRRRQYLDEVNRYMGQLSGYYQGIPVGIVWNEWYGKVMDWNYPNVFFPDNGQAIKDAMQQVRDSHPNLRLMPYTNGFIYDMDSGSYGAEAQAAATKKSDGTEQTQRWRTVGHYDTFAIMDPTQPFWQNKMAAVADNVFNTIGADGLYIDQVTAAKPREDMDQTHGHPLGGGNWWRAGYDSLFSKIDRLSGRDEKFVASEAAAEYMLDHTDGQYLGGWAISSLVPAYQTVYGGKVQLFGLRNPVAVSQANQEKYGLNRSEYKNDAYYVKDAVILTTGIEIGPVPASWFVQSPDTEAEARDYVTKLVHTRYKFRDFLAYGSMQRPKEISGDIPTIVSWWNDHGIYHRVSKKAIQHSIYRSDDGQKIAFFFVDASRDHAVDFLFSCDPVEYGASAGGQLQRYTMQVDDANVTWHHSSVPSGEIQVNLAPLDVVVYVLGE